MRQSTKGATTVFSLSLAGAAVIGTNLSLPKQDPLAELSLPVAGGYARDLASFKDNRGTLEDFGNLDGNGGLPAIPSTRLAANSSAISTLNRGGMGIGGDLALTEQSSPSANISSKITIGKKYKIEMSDSHSVDQPFGYSGDLERNGFNPIASYSYKMFRNEEERKGGRAFPFGVSNKQVESLINQVCVDIYSGRVNFIQGQTTAEVAARLLEEVDSVLVRKKLQICPKFLRQWLVAEAVSSWILAEFGPEPDSMKNLDFNAWWASIQPKNILERRTPFTACAGAAMLTKAITNELTETTGLSCDYVGGWAKDIETNQVPLLSNHSWNLFQLDKGFTIPSDCTPTADSRSWKKAWKVKQFGVRILPLNRECFEAFFEQKWGVIDYRNDNRQKFSLPLSNPISSMTLDDWKSLKINAEFKKLVDWGNDHPFN